MLADIIIPHHDRHDLLKRCLEGIDNKLFNIIIVSGGSFARNCNLGAKIAQTDTLIFLNDDVETINESLIELAKAPYELCGRKSQVLWSRLDEQ
jgi:GT2 family glycosyltransferase